MDRVDTTVLRGLAALLIINSHLEPIYPFGAMATGGLLGNSLFFLLSGFGLAAAEGVRRRSTLDWLGRRLVRIYPALILVVLVDHLVFRRGELIGWSFQEGLAEFIWPTPYGFVAQIVPFYFLFRGLQRIGDIRIYRRVGLALIPIYAAIWWLTVDPWRYHAAHWVAYFGIMLVGADLGSRVTDARSRSPHLAQLVGWLGVYLIAKLVIRTQGWVEATPVLHILILPVDISLLRGVASWQFGQALGQWPRLALVLTWIGRRSLELYLTHELVLRLPVMEQVPFPLNGLLFWPLAMLVGEVTSRCVEGLWALVGRSTESVRRSSSSCVPARPSGRGSRPAQTV